MMSSATACTPLSVLNTTVCPCAVSTCQLTATSVGSKSVSGMGIRTVDTSASMTPMSIGEQRDGVDLTKPRPAVGTRYRCHKADLVD